MREPLSVGGAPSPTVASLSRLEPTVLRAKAPKRLWHYCTQPFRLQQAGQYYNIVTCTCASPAFPSGRLDTLAQSSVAVRTTAVVRTPWLLAIHQHSLQSCQRVPVQLRGGTNKQQLPCCPWRVMSSEKDILGWPRARACEQPNTQHSIRTSPHHTYGFPGFLRFTS